MFEPWIIVAVALLGFFAGVIGGMTGIGGSLIMIPGLVTLFGQGLGHAGIAGEFAGLHQHVYQAAAMIVNVCVAAPATWRHLRARAVVPEVIKWMLPASLLFIFIGVWASNWKIFSDESPIGNGPLLLGRVLAGFMLYTALDNIRRMFRRPRPVDEPVDLTHVTPGRSATVGAATGFTGGLLGLGGGGVAVPLQQLLLKLRLRNCIANSAAAMCVTSLFGALFKNATLPQHGAALGDALLLAGLLAPTALIGGAIGGWLTHTLPVRAVRLGLILLMLAAAWKMAAI